MVSCAQIDNTPDIGDAVRLRFSAFVKTLRSNGFAVGLAESHDALNVFCAIDPSNRHLLRATLRSLFASRREDWEKFDAVFNAFWFGHGIKGQTRFEDSRKSPQSTSATDNTETRNGPNPRDDNEPAETQIEAPSPASQSTGNEQGGAAAQDSLAQKDFRHILSQDELHRAYALADRLAARMHTRLSRRDKRARHGARLDLRRTIHRSISRGGTPIDLVFRKRKPKPLRVVMLLDASGSMSPYTAAFVRFMHGMLGSFKHAAAFLFHTHLVDVTSAMTDRDPQRAINRFSLVAQGVGGGTKIGESLAAFNTHHAKRVVRSRTVIMMISDGYETGEATELAQEMATLRRRCRRIAWLNPMAGWEGYAPEAAGMKAALPYVDFFAPAHSLASLEALEPYLARL